MNLLILHDSIEGEPAALYRRVSTDHQDGSLEVQEKRSLDYAAYKHLVIKPGLTFADPDTSGSIPLTDRPGGHALLGRLQHGDIKHVIVAKLDRLGRNTKDFLTTIDTLTKLGVTLHIADFGGDSMSTQGHWGRMILTILAAVAEAELGEIRDRTRKRMKLKFDKLELTGNVPYGWDCLYTFADGSTLTSPMAHSATPGSRNYSEAFAFRGRVLSKRLVPEPFEQQTIRLMHQWRTEGRKLEQIAGELNKCQVPTKLGSQWQAGHVDSVLKSRHTALVLQTPVTEEAQAA
jgi:DNA invertase Pin-like site-specific DNA recombinase